MTVADRCPGVLRAHVAADGLLIRLRVPGGRTTGTVLGAVSALAGRHGNGDLQLTSRSALQLRGLADPVPAALAGALGDLGLLPSARHDRVRNLVASPFTGLDGDPVDLRTMITELDEALIADAELAELPGRFLFALDDGAGDVAGRPFDLGYRAVDAESGHVLVGSARFRIPVAMQDAVPTLIALAHAFLADRPPTGRHWHVADLPGWAETRAVVVDDADPPRDPGPRLGAVAGAASVRVPLGMLTPAQARLVAEHVGDDAVVITPDRGLVLPGRAAFLPQLVGAGLVADEHSGWALVSACVGAAHCARTSLDTRAAAAELVRAGLHERVHVSGCDRRCGAPAVAHRELVAS